MPPNGSDNRAGNSSVLFANRFFRLLTILVAVCCLGLIQIGLLVSNQPLAATEEKTHSADLIRAEVVEIADRPAQVEVATPIIGEACGGGVSLAPSTICLHGTVFGVEGNQLPIPLDGIEVSIRYGDGVVSSTTFVHAGTLTPTYGIDISTLLPAYLEPIEITAVWNGQTYAKSVTLHPNFETQSQEVDLYLDETAAFDAEIVWGTVVNYGEIGIVEGVTVTAQYGSPAQLARQVTTPFGPDPTPVFRFTAADLLGYLPSSPITLSVDIEGKIDSLVVSPDGSEPLYLNLVAGWECDDYDPFNKGRSAWSFNRGGSAWSFPDTACIHGVALLNGSPSAGVHIEVDTGSEIFAGETNNNSKTNYALAISGAEALVGNPLTVTAIYNGLSQTWVTDTLSLDESNGLRVDLNILDAAALGNILSPNSVEDIEVVGDDVWVATSGGVVHYTLAPEPQLVKWYTSYNSDLAFDRVDSIQRDHLDRLWIKTKDNTSFQRFEPETETWTSVVPWENELEGHAVVTDPHQVWFFRNALRVYRLDPATERWEEIEVGNRDINEIAVDANGVTWMADNNDGLRRYDPVGNSLTLYDTSNSGIIADELDGLTIGSDQSIWMASDGNGVARYQPDGDLWQVWRLSDDVGLPADKRIFDIDIAPDGTVLLGTVGDLLRYDPLSDRWESLDLSQSVYPTDFTQLMEYDEEGGLWVKHGEDGIGRLNPDGSWSFLGILDQGPLTKDVNVVEEAADGTVWYGSTNGLSRFDPDTRQWTGFNTFNSGLSQNWITAVGFTPDNRVFIGNLKGFDIYDRSQERWTFVSEVEVEGEMEDTGGPDAFYYDDSRGGLWVGSNGGLFYYNVTGDETWQKYTPPGFTNTLVAIRDIAQAPDQSIWIATNGRGFYRFDPDQESWERYSTELAIPEIPSDKFTSIGVDSSGTVWAGLTDTQNNYGGLVRYQPESETFTYFEEEPNGLGSENIVGLVVDRYDRLWISTWDGLHSLDTLDMSWERFEVSEQLGIDIFKNLTFGQNNDLWIPSENGVAHWYLPLSETDLILSGSGPEKIVSGQDTTIQYRLEVNNQGETAGDVTISFGWPITSSLQSISPQLTNIEGNRFDIGVMAPGATQVISLTLSGPFEDWVNSTHQLVAAVEAGARETLVANNRLEVETRIVEPDRADVATSLSGPPLIVPNQSATFKLIAQNLGSLDAENSKVQLQLPDGMRYLSASQSPITSDPPTWSLGTLSSADGTEPTVIDVELVYEFVDNPTNQLNLSASISTLTTESIDANNMASAYLPLSSVDAQALILIAPQRLAARYGTSLVADRLYALAQHPKVNGLILDVEAFPTVAASFAAWDANPTDWQAANAVAQAIKSEAEGYLTAYPAISSIVIVGGDEIFPFHRSPDRNPTMWHERTYLSQLDPGSSVYHAVAADMLLSDDFYAASEATMPTSPFWPSGSEIYLPAFALGRLVETPAEIIATIDYFLENDGLFSGSAALIGGDLDLAGDYIDQQCGLLQGLGYATTCATDEAVFVEGVEASSLTVIWSAWHSTHYGMGTFGNALNPALIEHSLLNGAVNGSMGCHAGLNVPDQEGLYSQDLVQEIAAHGGISVGSTAFTYGSRTEISYSERLFADILSQIGKGDSIGEAVLHAKSSYYAERSWFDLLDEKTLLPVTVYGLPMSEMVLPQPIALQIEAANRRQQTGLSLHQNEQTINFSAPAESYQRVIGVNGDYFTYNGQSKAQHLLPIQPAAQIPIDAQSNGDTLKGVLIRDASFIERPSFDPLIEESFAMGAAVSQNVEPALPFEGWDRELPMGINQAGAAAYLDLTLGLFDAATERELLLGSATFELLYGDPAASYLPVIGQVTLTQNATDDPYRVEVVISDKTGVKEALLLYERPDNQWESVSLTSTNGREWGGAMPSNTTRYFFQIVNVDQNLSRTGWSDDFSAKPQLQSTPTPTPTGTPDSDPDSEDGNQLYLPIMWDN